MPRNESCIVEKINLHQIVEGRPECKRNVWEFMYKYQEKSKIKCN